MVISRRLCSTNNTVSSMTVYIYGIPFEEVSSFKYLGVIIDSSLSWSEHLKKIAIKTKRLVGWLYRQYYQFASSEVV